MDQQLKPAKNSSPKQPFIGLLDLHGLPLNEKAVQATRKQTQDDFIHGLRIGLKRNYINHGALIIERFLVVA